MTSSNSYEFDIDGGRISMELSAYVDRSRFAGTLQKLNGEKPWAVSLTRLPERMDHQDFLDQKLEETTFIQAGGYADRMTVEIRQPGGREWGVESVWSVVGHQAEGQQDLDVPTKLPRSTQMISRAEVFDADEAADLFLRTTSLANFRVAIRSVRCKAGRQTAQPSTSGTRLVS
jgi:hypothetical protein